MNTLYPFLGVQILVNGGLITFVVLEQLDCYLHTAVQLPFHWPGHRPGAPARPGCAEILESLLITESHQCPVKVIGFQLSVGFDQLF